MAEDFKKQIEEFEKKLEDGKKGVKPPKGTKAEVIVGDAASEKKKAEEALVDFIKNDLPDGVTMEAIVTGLHGKFPGLEITPNIVALINQAIAAKQEEPEDGQHFPTLAGFASKVQELVNKLAVEVEPFTPPNLILTWVNGAYAVTIWEGKIPPVKQSSGADMEELFTMIQKLLAEFLPILSQKAESKVDETEKVFDLAVKLTAFVLHTAKELPSPSHGLSPVAMHFTPVPPEVLATLKALVAPVDVIGNKDDDGPALPSWTPEDQKALDAKILASGKQLDSLTMELLPIKHFTIAGKPKTTYLKAKGVLMAFHESWAGNPDHLLAIWALDNPQKALTVTVHHPNGSAINLLATVLNMLPEK